MESQVRTALLGPEHSFHHIAALSYLGEDLVPVFKNSFEGILQSLSSGESDIAIIAVKNSHAGYVGNNLIDISKHGFYINDEIKLRIRFFLAAKQLVDTKDIVEIVSHPVAIRQCMPYLQKFSNAILTEVSSTAEAANIVSNDSRTNIAVLAGGQVIEQTKLAILEEALLDRKDNITRFVVVSAAHQTIPTTPRTIISVEGNRAMLDASVADSPLVIREQIDIPGTDASYCEFISPGVFATNAYINSIKNKYDGIRIIGYYSECKRILNT